MNLTPEQIAKIAEILEFLMILSFGISWPLSVYRSYRARTAKGKSLLFTCFIWTGYVLGVFSKILSHNFNLAFYMYFPNLTFITIDLILYFRNRALDKAAESGEKK